MNIEERAIAQQRRHDFQVIPAKDVTPAPVEWLWPGRIACGCINIIAGPGGLGKSMTVMSMAAIVTRGGRFPFSPEDPGCVPGDVFWLTGEESIDRQLKPRAVAAGVDVDRLHFITGICRLQNDGEVDDGAMVKLSQDAAQLVGLRKEYPDMRLIVIDPLSAFLDAKDAHREADVRQVLTPWVKAAEATGVAVVLIAHHNKGQGAVRDRLSGSTAIRNTARIVHTVLENPDNEQERLFLTDKNNLSDMSLPGLAFQIEGSDITDNGLVIPAACVNWLRETEQTASDVVTAGDTDRSALDEARQFLEDYLLENGPSAFAEIMKAARALGVSEKTLRRAKGMLRVTSEKSGYQGKWRWHLPEPPPPFDDDSKTVKPPKVLKGQAWAPLGDCTGPHGLKASTHAGFAKMATVDPVLMKRCLWPPLTNELTGIMGLA